MLDKSNIVDKSKRKGGAGWNACTQAGKQARGHGGTQAGTHAGEPEADREAGEHAGRLAGRHARTHAGGQAGGLAPADLLLNTGTPGGTHTADLRPRRIVPG